jgi:hypothetical protein
MAFGKKPEAGCRFSKAVEAAGACQRVVPGTTAHTKEMTGNDPISMRSWGVEPIFTRPSPARRTAFKPAEPGDRQHGFDGSKQFGVITMTS